MPTAVLPIVEQPTSSMREADASPRDTLIASSETLVVPPEQAKSRLVRTQDRFDRYRILADRILAVLLMVPAVPLLAVIALLVRLTSHGPAFYWQTRVGRHGKLYTIYKLRTMYHDCERDTGP